MTWNDALAECRARFPLQAVTIDGVAWSLLDTGAGEGTLLLLPGALGFADTSFHFVLAFAPFLRVLSVDYPPALTDGDRLIDGLAALLAQRDLAPAHVVGGSYSGLVAQRLAERYPQRAASLILANTWAADPRRARYFRPAAWLVARTPARLLQRVMAAYMDSFLPGADPPTRFWRSYFEAILPAFTPALLANRLRTFASLDAAEWQLSTAAPGGHGERTERPQSCMCNCTAAFHAHGVGRHLPVLLVESSDDRLFGTASREALRRRYPQAQATRLACPGHAAALTHVEEYVRLYREWLTINR